MINTSAKRVNLQDPTWYERTRTPVTGEGVVPFYRYVIRQKGRVELGILSCRHVSHAGDAGRFGREKRTREFSLRSRLRRGLSKRSFVHQYRPMLERLLYHTPWLRPDPQAGLVAMTSEQLAAPHDTIPPGALARHRARPDHPVQVPDLIGVQGRKYLDRSGLQHHLGIADLMRYAALNQRGDDMPISAGLFRLEPSPCRWQ